MTTPATTPLEQQVYAALATVYDPEVAIDIVSLGIVYGVAVDDGVATITYTFTTPRCPMGRHITNGIVTAVSRVPGIRRVVPNLVWEPAWNPSRISEDVR